MTAVLKTPEPAVDRRLDASPRAGRVTVVFVALAVAVAVATVLSVTLGSVTVPLAETVRVLSGGSATDTRWDMVIRDLRLPRTVTALAVGAALGIAGLQMQTLFRNALADPFILGASSGASLGVAVVVVAGGGGAGGFTAGLAGLGRAGVVIAAALGAAAVLLLIVVLARWVKSAVTLLLIGVMLGSATTAVVSVLLVYADPQRSQQFLVWGLGSFTATTWSDLRLLVPVVLGGIAVALLTVRALNALLLGEGYARSMGIDIRIVRLTTVISAALLAGATTAFCGPIGFLGLIVPHLARMAFGTSDHRVLLPGVALLGGALALICGIVSQMPGTDTVFPLNAVTAIVGAPVVIAVLIRSRRGALGAAL
ncbi:FecCD family ABC transporter permease [Rhodococcus sp. PD04]|uniref:FecCD family ABC transporter permease n=1 Tax=Rhodococcus sp. PD04 TaxID=3109594 RepID=UPI002DDBE7C5|nr:iron ABC transporter permease [Rhodococcus sp. PD04]MDC3728945.1 iron ABC transporter permease [Rhodococcus sp. Rp3]WSE25597.1 iron ABC transporter permease [Rhodococcus sp. PD04]